MSRLILVRHGQAQFMTDDYDRLSETGEEQSRVLGTHWAALGQRFDEVYTGTMKRQIDTARWVGRSYLEAGLPWPEAIADPAFNEFDVNARVGEALPELRERHPRLRELIDAFKASIEDERRRTFQLMFEEVMKLWVKGEFTIEGAETWVDFKKRVHGAVERIISDGRGGRNVAVFTSGGPIGAAMQFALGAPDQTAVELNWRARNCSLTEFVFTKGRISLDTFNAIPHLNDPELVTFR